MCDKLTWIFWDNVHQNKSQVNSMKCVKHLLGGQIDAKMYRGTEKNKVWSLPSDFCKGRNHTRSANEEFYASIAPGQRKNNHAPGANTDSHKTRAPTMYRVFPPAQKSPEALHPELKLLGLLEEIQCLPCLQLFCIWECGFTILPGKDSSLCDK